MRSLLKNKTIFLYVLYTFVYALYPINAVIALYFLAKGLSFADIGIVFGVFSISGFLFEIPTGYFGDKFGRRVSVMVGLVVMAITAYIWTFLTNTLGFAVFAAMWMLGLAFISGSFDAYIYDHLKSVNQEKMYDKVLSVVGSIAYFAAAVGSVLGTYLYSLNVNFPYYLLSMLFLVSAFIVYLMPPEKQDRESLVQEQLSVFSGLKHVFRSKTLLLVTLFISLLFGFYDYYIHSVDKPYILSLGLFDVKWLGIFVAITYLAQSALVSQFSKLKDKLSEAGVMTLCWFVFVASLLGMSKLYGVAGLISVLFFYSVDPFREAIINSFSQEHIPSRIRATTLSSIKVYEAIAGAALGILAGVVFDLFDVRQGLLIAFAYSVLIYGVIHVYRKSHKHKVEGVK